MNQLFTILALGAQSAGAVPPTQGLASPTWFQVQHQDTSNTSAEIEAVAICVAKSSTWLARFHPTKSGLAGSSGQTERCAKRLQRNYRVPNWILAGSIARAYYVSRHDVKPPLNDGPYYIGVDQTKPELLLTRLKFFDCVLQGNTSKVDELIRATAGSLSERTLASDIAQGSAKCVSSDTAVIGVQGLKFGLADVLFRRSLTSAELDAPSDMKIQN